MRAGDDETTAEALYPPCRMLVFQTTVLHRSIFLRTFPTRPPANRMERNHTTYEKEIGRKSTTPHAM